MAQKREKEETELKVPETLPMCTPPQTIPAPPPPIRSPAESADPIHPKPSEQRSNRTVTSPKKPDLACSGSKRPREASRCSGSGCRKVIGFMGFRCRCGDVFCGEHRYSDRHDCSYDYKAAGREAIARENPVVRAAKLVKV
ncbi:hypothetical protein ACS0TY_025110 [Phlomoides rotata]